MSQPYVGEIRMFGGSFAPVGWAMCNGALQPISENETLFNLIGTKFGGDGQETFGLPNLQGRVPIHAGQGPGLSQTYQIGQMAGVEQVTLNVQQIPIHNHAMLASTAAGANSDPAGNVTSQHPTMSAYTTVPSGVSLSPLAVASVGGSQPHDNMQPYLTISFIISLFGIYPHT